MKTLSRMAQTTTLLYVLITIFLLTRTPSASATNNTKDSSSVAGITVTVSQSGLQYAKSVVLNSLLSEITPSLLPDVKTHVTSPIGRVEVQLSHVELAGANVSDSDLDLGQTGVTVFVGDVEMGMRFHWAYQYSAAYVPFSVKDEGWADVKVSGMQASLTFTLVAHNGTLRLAVVECGTSIEDLEIELQGRASRLYRFFVHTFEDEIRVATEVAVMKKILASVEYLDNYLQALPRFLPIDGVSTMDVTIVQDPMIGVLKWRVDELPEEAWLNTYFWRWLLPQLYKKYPNMDMALDFACSEAPSIHLQRDGVKANAIVEVILLVKSYGQSQAVACVSLGLSINAIVNVVGNNITAEAMLDELNVELIWSDVGRFPIILLQPMLRTIISRVILPNLNKNLAKGFPLPMFPFVELENADIQHEEGFIFVCSDVYYKGGIIKTLNLPPMIYK